MNNRYAVLEFDAALDAVESGKPLRDNLSAIVYAGKHLWLASDETTSVERLTTEDGKTFRHHKKFRISDFIRLPQGDDKEIDIEGLDYRDNFLWVVGSHSLKRAKPDQKSSDIKREIKRLSQIDKDENRYLLARIPLVEQDGEFELRESCPDPSDPSRVLTAAHLPFKEDGNELMETLSEDAHLSPFLSTPGKDNGFDIEGLAVLGGRVFVGLRGPVLRGWSVILELKVEETDSQRLSLNRIGPKGRPYKKHFLQLDGLGIRDLLAHGSSLLILAGPTMDLDGPVAVFRWEKGAHGSNGSLIPRSQLDKLLDVPYGYRADHAEGMTLAPSSNGRDSLLIIYDSPSGDRVIKANHVRADVFDFEEL